MKTHVNIRRLRLFEQIITFFIVALLIPLIVMSLLFFNFNQRALKKELRGFTEHMASSMFDALQTDLQWHRQQAMQARQVYLRLRAQGATPPEALAELKVLLGPQAVLAAGVYRADGTLLAKAGFSPRLVSVDALALGAQAAKSAKTHESVSSTSTKLKAFEGKKSLPEAKFYQTEHVFAQQVHPALGKSTQAQIILHYLLPLTELAQAQQETQAAKTEPSAGLWLQQPFPKLDELLARQQNVFEGAVFIVDEAGVLKAGPPALLARQSRLDPKQMAAFNALSPGSVGEIRTTLVETQSLDTRDAKATEADADPEVYQVEAVVLKLPDVGWGLVIQSPYVLKQQYIKRAREQSLLLVVLTVIGVTILAAGYIVGLTRNFRQLIKGIKAIADGNYTRRIRLIANALTPYEIVYLTGEFNRMARKTHEAWERTQKLDELKSTLIDTVSHELRTPLTNIKGYASRLLRHDAELSPQMRQQSLKRIKVNADRLNRLVDDLLVIPELEQSGLRVFEDRVPLMPLIEQCIQLIHDREAEQSEPLKPLDRNQPNNTYNDAQKTPRRPSIQITGDAAQVSALTVLADPDRLAQVLINLLDNAVKYAADATQPVVIEVQTLPHEARVQVRNASSPVSAEALAGLFDKFARLDDSTTRTTRGTGLGLYIARELMHAMGGQIMLDYAEGQFTATLIVRQA
ncbi:MAG: HAMP domain-containing sensor histidine kinase [Vampirovibrionales bacterium]|nr:HAMP domain-containing sensor histidine kinase [Vampirovibrionales bacterium]